MDKNLTVKLKYLHIAPRKTRFVAEVIKGLPVSEAEAELVTGRRRAGEAILKLLRSAVANAKKNHKLEADKLYIKEVRVDGGPRLKRFRPRAFGRVNLIEKKMSHVTLVLGVSEKLSPSRFVIKEKPKKEAKPKKAPTPEKGRDPSQSVEKKSSKEEQKDEEKNLPALPDRPAGGRPERGMKPLAKPGFFRRVFRRKSV